jgi:hypothetical protein
MFGESILVSPKVDHITKKGLWPVVTYLPTSVQWYNLQSRMIETR